MKKIILLIVVFLLGAVSTLALDYTLEFRRLDQEYEAAQKAVMEALIEVKASSSAGVTQTQWKEHIKRVTIHIGKLNLLKKTPFQESSALTKVLKRMRAVDSAWDIQNECRQKKELDRSCFANMGKLLWENDVPLFNADYKKGVDDRIVLTAGSSNAQEYARSYEVDVKMRNEVVYGDGVSRMLSSLSNAVDDYFSTIGVYLG